MHLKAKKNAHKSTLPRTTESKEQSLVPAPILNGLYLSGLQWDKQLGQGP